jgi:hypothetical protein
MGIRRLTGEEISELTYDQAGFDIIEKDERDISSEDHIVVYPGVGTDIDNILYAGNTGTNAHWIGLHNCGTSNDSAPIPIQAESLVGDDLTKNPSAAFDYDEARYINLAPGDVIFGRFSSVGILKSAGPTNYKYRLRLIRGV